MVTFVMLKPKLIFGRDLVKMRIKDLQNRIVSTNSSSCCKLPTTSVGGYLSTAIYAGGGMLYTFDYTCYLIGFSRN